MKKAERLALAVRARLASIRADRVGERTGLVDRQYAPVARAIKAYVKQYGKEADPSDDFDAFLGLVIQHGGVNLGREDVLAAIEMYVERVAAAADAAAATHELSEAMGNYQGTVLRWVGCTKRQFEAALASSPSP